VSRVCIDTHALVWYLLRPKRLGRPARRFLRAADAGRAEVLIPAVVAVRGHDRFFDVGSVDHRW